MGVNENLMFIKALYFNSIGLFYKGGLAPFLGKVLDTWRFISSESIAHFLGEAPECFKRKKKPAIH